RVKGDFVIAVGVPFQDLVALLQGAAVNGDPEVFALREEGGEGPGPGYLIPGTGGCYRVEDLLAGPVGADVGDCINPNVPEGFGKLDAARDLLEFDRGVPVVI